ncbi:hypothetical protein BH18THE2_BH18THE2_09980 [soil metagenome]
MMCGLASDAIAAFAVMHFYQLGHYPYLFSYLPVQVWIISLAVSVGSVTYVYIGVAGHHEQS